MGFGKCPAQLRSLRFLCNWSRLQNYSYPISNFFKFFVSISLSRSLKCVGNLRDIRDFEVNCKKLTPLQNLITLSHLSLSPTIHSLSLSLFLFPCCLPYLSLSLSLSILVYHSCSMRMRIYEFVYMPFCLFDTLDFDRKWEGKWWAQKGPTLFQVCVLFS